MITKPITIYFHFTLETHAQYLARSDMFAQRNLLIAHFIVQKLQGGPSGIYLLNLFDVVVFRPKDNLLFVPQRLLDTLSVKLEYRF